MNTYKVIFSFNEILTCMHVLNWPPFDGDLHFESKGRYLIKAYIHAPSEQHARDIATELAQSFNAVM